MRGLGLAGDVAPLAGFQVDIRPLGLPQFARAHEKHGSQLEGPAGHRRALVGPQRAQQLADLRRLGQACEVLGLPLLQCTQQDFAESYPSPSRTGKLVLHETSRGGQSPPRPFTPASSEQPEE